jgi:hypothetical protein
MNRLCKFTCKYGYCPDDTCTAAAPADVEPIEISDPNDYLNAGDIRWQNNQGCIVWKYPSMHEDMADQCYDPCVPQTEEAKANGETVNYGCMLFTPAGQVCNPAQVCMQTRLLTYIATGDGMGCSFRSREQHSHTGEMPLQQLASQ